jgi:hypothetical protein
MIIKLERVMKIKITYRKKVRKKRLRRRTIEYEGKGRKREKGKPYNKLEQRKEMKVRRKE